MTEIGGPGGPENWTSRYVGPDEYDFDSDLSPDWSPGRRGRVRRALDAVGSAPRRAAWWIADRVDERRSRGRRTEEARRAVEAATSGGGVGLDGPDSGAPVVGGPVGSAESRPLGPVDAGGLRSPSAGGGGESLPGGGPAGPGRPLGDGGFGGGFEAGYGSGYGSGGDGGRRPPDYGALGYDFDDDDDDEVLGRRPEAGRRADGGYGDGDIDDGLERRDRRPGTGRSSERGEVSERVERQANVLMHHIEDLATGGRLEGPRSAAVGEGWGGQERLDLLDEMMRRLGVDHHDDVASVHQALADKNRPRHLRPRGITPRDVMQPWILPAKLYREYVHEPSTRLEGLNLEDYVEIVYMVPDTRVRYGSHLAVVKRYELRNGAEAPPVMMDVVVMPGAAFRVSEDRDGRRQVAPSEALMGWLSRRDFRKLRPGVNPDAARQFSEHEDAPGMADAVLRASGIGPADDHHGGGHGHGYQGIEADRPGGGARAGYRRRVVPAADEDNWVSMGSGSVSGPVAPSPHRPAALAAPSHPVGPVPPAAPHGPAAPAYPVSPAASHGPVAPDYLPLPADPLALRGPVELLSPPASRPTDGRSGVEPAPAIVSSGERARRVAEGLEEVTDTTSRLVLEVRSGAGVSVESLSRCLDRISELLRRAAESPDVAREVTQSRLDHAEQVWREGFRAWGQLVEHMTEPEWRLEEYGLQMRTLREHFARDITDDSLSAYYERVRFVARPVLTVIREQIVAAAADQPARATVLRAAANRYLIPADELFSLIEGERLRIQEERLRREGRVPANSWPEIVYSGSPYTL